MEHTILIVEDEANTFAVENIAKYIMENIVNLSVVTKWQMS